MWLSGCAGFVGVGLNVSSEHESKGAGAVQSCDCLESEALDKLLSSLEKTNAIASAVVG